MKEKQTYSAKLAQLEYEKSELELKEKSLKNSLSQWKELKENEELELKKELQTEKGIAQRSVQEYKDKFTQAEESLKEMERKLYLSNSEHDKQMALLKQRLEYFENLTEQSTSKEKDLALEIKNLKKEHLNQMKESSNKYEELNKEFRTKFDQQLQKILDLEVKIILDFLFIIYRMILQQKNRNSSLRERSGKRMSLIPRSLWRKPKELSRNFRRN